MDQIIEFADLEIEFLVRISRTSVSVGVQITRVSLLYSHCKNEHRLMSRKQKVNNLAPKLYRQIAWS